MKYFLLFMFPFLLNASVKISIIGDSISNGHGVEKGECYVDLLEKRYALERKDIVILNRSFDGALSEDAKAITIQLLTMDKPDYFISLLGMNDAGINTPKNQLQDNLFAALGRASMNCKGVVLGGCCSIQHPEYNTTLAETYHYLCEKLELHPLMLLDLEVMATSPDGIHPNAVGHQMIADKLYNFFHILGLY